MNGVRSTYRGPQKWHTTFCGREYDDRLLDELPSTADSCDKRGEFHTCVYDSPFFAYPVLLDSGAVVEREGYFYADQSVAERSGGSGSACFHSLPRP